MFSKSLMGFIEKHTSLLVFILTFLFISQFTLFDSCHLPAISRGSDAQVFATMGYAWLEGLLPYKDLFDHKGPFLYFINAIGFLISDGHEFGIFIIEILFCISWVYLVFKLFNNIYFTCISIIVITLSIYRITFEGGNLTEEYAILFSVISIYIYFKKPFSNYINFFIVGICGGLSALLRVNLAITPFIIFLFLIFSRKNFKEIVYSIISCGIGFVISIIPFIFYFIHHNALYDFYISYIKFNIFYITEYRSIYSVLTTFFKIKFWVIFIVILIAYSLYHKLYKEVFLSLVLLLSCMVFGIFLSMRSYPHYFSILIPPSIFLIYIIKEKLYIKALEYYNLYSKKFGEHKLHHIKIFTIIYTILLLIPYNILSLINFDKLDKEILYLNKLGINDSSRILVQRHNQTAIYHLTKTLPQQRIFFTTGSIRYDNNEFSYGSTPISEFSKNFDFIISHKSEDIPGFEKCGVFRQGIIFRNKAIANDIAFLDDLQLLTSSGAGESAEKRTVKVGSDYFEFIYYRKTGLLSVGTKNKVYDKNISIYIKPKVISAKEYIRKIIRYLDNASAYPDITSPDIIGYAYKRIDDIVTNIPIQITTPINNLDDVVYIGFYDELNILTFYKLKWQ